VEQAVAALQEQALEAALAQGDRDRPRAGELRQLIALAAVIEEGGAAAQGIARWLRGRALAKIDEMATFAPGASASDLQAVAGLGDADGGPPSRAGWSAEERAERRLADLEELHELRRRLLAQGTDVAEREASRAAWERAVGAAEDDIAALLDAGLRETVARALAGGESAGLQGLLRAIAPELERIDQMADRFLALRAGDQAAAARPKAADPAAAWWGAGAAPRAAAEGGGAAGARPPPRRVGGSSRPALDGSGDPGRGIGGSLTWARFLAKYGPEAMMTRGHGAVLAVLLLQSCSELPAARREAPLPTLPAPAATRPTSVRPPTPLLRCTVEGAGTSEQDARQAHRFLELAVRSLNEEFEGVRIEEAMRDVTCELHLHAKTDDGPSAAQNYLRTEVRDGRYSAMLHLLAPSAYHADDRSNVGEPFDEVYFFKTLVHELSTIFLDLATRSKGSGWRFFSAPSWFVQGYEEYLALLRSSEHTRTVTLSKYIQKLRENPSRVRPGFLVEDTYIDGSLLLLFLHETFGKARVQAVLMSRNPSFYGALSEELGLTDKELYERWDEWRRRLQTEGSSPAR
jgi:hypothetical protein